MTEEEFQNIWTILGYDRRTHKRPDVEFPNEEKLERKAYGHNGKGRLSLFCFTDQYTVKTCKDGNLTTATVTKKPIVFYEIDVKEEKISNKQGTSISLHNLTNKSNVSFLSIFIAAAKLALLFHINEGGKCSNINLYLYICHYYL